MTGFYYMRSEAPLRQTIWYSSVGWGGMIGSLMAAGIEKANQSSLKVPKWELIFIVLGAITIAWGAVLFFFLADGPSNAFGLRPEQRTLAVARVAQGGVGIKSKKFKTEQMWEALVDPKAWCLTIAMFGSSVPNGILVRSPPFLTCLCEEMADLSENSPADQLFGHHCEFFEIVFLVFSASARVFVAPSAP